MLMFDHISTQHAQKPMFSYMNLYIQEAFWKGMYVLLSMFLCFCVCLHFFDVLDMISNTCFIFFELT